jgi:molybdopterin molybdotransferase
MIAFDEAIELVRSVATPLGTETVPIAEAGGRVLARPVIAQIDSPRSNVSAMDGYAVRDEDLRDPPVTLQLIGGSFAGGGWSGSVAPGTCVRIFTGAPVPQGADRVIMQENVRCSGNAASIDEHPGPGRHIRKRASDFARGDELLPEGRLLDQRAIVAAAGADLAELELYRRPRVSILSTGDELAAPGTARELADAIPDSVSLGIAALAARWGAECVGRTRLRDDLPTMEQAAVTAVESSELIVVTGGASVGERDFAKTMFEPLGLDLIFSKVSIKPGKPVWLGRVQDKLVMGLPGNPTSALVTARLLLAPLLAGMVGRRIDAALQWRFAPLAGPLKQGGARETFHRGQWNGDLIEILSFQDSSAQKALAAADVLVRQRSCGAALKAGTQVDVLDF